MRRWRTQVLLLLALAIALPALPTAWAVRELFDEALQPLLGGGFEEGVRAGFESTRIEIARDREEFDRALAVGAPYDTLGADRLRSLPERDRNTILALDLGPEDPPLRLDLAGRTYWIARRPDVAGAPEWALRAVPDSLSARVASVADAMRRIESLRQHRNALGRSLLTAYLVAHGVVVLVLIAVALWLVRRWTAPIAQLEGGLEAVARGDLTVRVPPSGSEDMRQVLERFNRMVEELGSQRRALARLEKRTAWQQMARSLAHEIKNPLTPIQLAVQELHTAYDGSNPRYAALLSEGAQIVEEEVERLRLLVQGFSQLARPSRDFSRIDLGELLSELDRSYGESLAMDVPPAPVFVQGDREGLRRLFLNLVNNAIEAQKRTGAIQPIELTLRRSGDASAWCVEVRDHGPGVSPEDRDRIFEPDFTTRSDGIGLGLAIARSTAEAHGGTLEVDAPSDGAAGASFVLVLPSTFPEET
ncbi:MAG: HAMP domain-containing sensor histidine kinase [Candidatus Eisenbacteria bacterium]